jgi:hypothetical protein
MDIKLAIFSSCFFQRGTNYTTPALAAVSNFLAQKHGYRTRLYTDSINYHFFKNIKYDEVVFLDDEFIKQFPHIGWSLGKLLAMSMTKEPFVHIDFDLLLINDIPNHIKFNECFAFHNETYFKKNLFRKETIYEFYSKYSVQNELNYKEAFSTNCAIIGGQNFQLINESCNKVIEYSILNKSFFEKSYGLPQSRVAVFFEQILLLNIIRNKTLLKTIPTVLQEETLEKIRLEGQELKLIHLWGQKADFFNHFIKIAKNKKISF